MVTSWICFCCTTTGTLKIHDKGHRWAKMKRCVGQWGLGASVSVGVGCITLLHGWIAQARSSLNSVLCVGLQGPFKEAELKASGLEQELPGPYHRPTNLIVMLPPPPWATWPTPSCPLLGKLCGSFLTCSYRDLDASNQPASVSKTLLSSTNQQASRCILRPHLSLGYKKRHDLALVVYSPWLSGSWSTMLQ